MKNPRYIQYVSNNYGVCNNADCSNKLEDSANNGAPLFEGMVCDKCNQLVIKARLESVTI